MKQEIMDAINIKLTQEQMDRIDNIDKNYRLIKGQVFCWKSSCWQDLWDHE